MSSFIYERLILINPDLQASIDSFIHAVHCGKQLGLYKLPITVVNVLFHYLVVFEHIILTVNGSLTIIFL